MKQQTIKVTTFPPKELPRIAIVETWEDAARFIFHNVTYDDTVFVCQDPLTGKVLYGGFFDMWKEEQFEGHRVEI